MPVNMKNIMRYARVKPVPAPVPAPEAAPVPAPEVEAAPVEAPEVEAPEVEAVPAEVEAAPAEVEAPEWSMVNTKAELTAAAEAAGIDVRSNWKKAEILAALMA